MVQVGLGVPFEPAHSNISNLGNIPVQKARPELVHSSLINYPSIYFQTIPADVLQGLGVKSKCGEAEEKDLKALEMRGFCLVRGTKIGQQLRENVFSMYKAPIRRSSKQEEI